MIKLHTNINDIHLDEWNNLIQSSDTANYFQTKSCYDLYASMSFMKPFVFAVSDERKLLALVVGYVIADGNIIKKFFSRRAIIPGGMMIRNNAEPKAVELLLNHLNKELKFKSIYTEFRNYNDYSTLKDIFERSGFNYLPHLNFHVKTTNINEAFSNLNTNRKRNIKSNIQNGIKVLIASKESEVFEYFKILQDLYLQKIKRPLFPIEFFNKLMKSDLGVILIVKYKDEIVGGSTCVRLPGNSLYEWFVCGLDGKYKGITPSTQATWACIEYAVQFGYPVFDMMGAGKPEDDYGVRDFKSKFGGELVEYGRFLCVQNKFLYNLGKQVLILLKSLK